MWKSKLKDTDGNTIIVGESAVLLMRMNFSKGESRVVTNYNISNGFKSCLKKAFRDQRTMNQGTTENYFFWVKIIEP